MILPRFIRFRDAPSYLGMDKDRFNAEVRPYLTEIPIGKQGVAFDRLDLDAWADEYRAREGRPGAKAVKEIAQWDGPNQQDSSSTRARASGGSTSASGDMAAFTKALAAVTSKKRNATSRRLEQLRQASVYGVRQKRKWREAATRYLMEEAINKDSGADDVYRLKLLDPFLGDRDLHQIHDGTLAAFIAWRRQPAKVRRKSGKVWVKHVKTKTINLDLALVRRILNLAGRKWRDEQGLTWLESAPLISMLKVRDARPPYPLSWAEQRLLMPELPQHLAEVCLLLLNSGLRSESEAVRLDWRWEIAVPELDCSVFLIPGDARKNEQDHVCVLNSVARSIIERCRGNHPTAVFTWRGKPLRSVNNSAWLNARARAAAKYQERFAEPAPEGFRTLHVHDLRHTVGRRLRAAGVALETRQAILGHKSGSITTHYSAAELRELLEAMEFIATDNQRESHALTLLKRKAG